MYPVPLDQPALDFFSDQVTGEKTYVDGWREQYGTDFYDSFGSLVLSEDSPLAFELNEGNVSATGLMVYYAKYGDIFSDISYNDHKNCLCVA